MKALLIYVGQVLAGWLAPVVKHPGSLLWTGLSLALLSPFLFPSLKLAGGSLFLFGLTVACLSLAVHHDV